MTPAMWAEARELLRLLHGRAQLAADGRAARSLRCPWCKAAPGEACVNPATGRPLTITANHPARHEAAGVRPPAVDADAVAQLRTGHGEPG